jgi:hypothetical protein
MAGSGLAGAANWTTSDLMGLGWLAGILDMDTLARIPARSMDGVRGFILFSQKWAASGWVPVSFILSRSIPIATIHKEKDLEL